MYNIIKLKKIPNDINQNINEKMIISLLQKCYLDCAFSTFPYLLHNFNSEKSIQNFKSGNCVALSMYLKNLLDKYYGVKSFLIPATIPNMFSDSKFLDISHVALAIPKNNKKTYIADVAFYFLNPIKVIFDSKTTRRILSKNVYEFENNNDPRKYKSINKAFYNINKLEKDSFLNKYQTIPKDTYYSECRWDFDANDKWKYYLIEVVNPDSSISNFFSNIKNKPFIMSTTIDKNGICKLDVNFRVRDSYVSITNSRNNKKKILFKELLKDEENFKKIILEEYNLSKYIDINLLNTLIDYIKKNKIIKNKVNIYD